MTTSNTALEAIMAISMLVWTTSGMAWVMLSLSASDAKDLRAVRRAAAGVFILGVVFELSALTQYVMQLAGRLPSP